MESSYTTQTASPSVGEWNRRYSEGAATRERPGSIPRPTSAAAPSSLANFSWQGTASPVQAPPPTEWTLKAPMAPPIPPTTFASHASPVLIQQPIPEMAQHQHQFHPQSFQSSPPSVLASQSPPTPIHPQAYVSHSPHLHSNSISPTFGHASVAPNPSSRPSKSPPSTTAAPPKRGRRPKNYVKTAEDERVEREEYLERNRLAALKSRQRKKERMGNLEQQAQEYCNHNDSLQKYALTLQSELLHLRSILSQLGGQSFPDVDGYFEREAQGGGIPTILRIAGPTLERDYQAVARV